MQPLENLLLVAAERGCKLGDGGLAVELLRELASSAPDSQRELLQDARRAYGPRAVAEMALELTDDRRHREARERVPVLWIEAVDRLDERQGRDLHEIVQGLA